MAAYSSSGILAVIFGVLAFIYPGLTLIVLATLFGAYALVDGILAVVSAVSAPKGQPRWWVTLLEGIVGIVVGVVDPRARLPCNLPTRADHRSEILRVARRQAGIDQAIIEGGHSPVLRIIGDGIHQLPISHLLDCGRDLLCIKRRGCFELSR
jgi:Short repeat of unknown function (DUF308)